MKIDQYQSKVGYSHEQSEYIRYNINPDAFGAGVARANQQLGETSLNFANSMMSIKHEVDQTKALELSNYIDELERTDLTDPNEGYFSKLGKDAMADDKDPTKGSSAVLESINQKILQKQQELGLTYGYGSKMAELVKARKMNMLYRAATNHELQQTKDYAVSTLNEAEALTVAKAINHRNNEDELNTIMGNGMAVILQKAKLAHWDNDTLRIEIAKFKSKFHASIINAYAQDNSLRGTEYFEAHKDEMLPNDLERSLSLKNNTEAKVLSKSLADNLYALYSDDEEKALAELEKKNLPIDKYDATYQRLTTNYARQRRLEEQVQSQLVDQFYNNAVGKLKNGEVITIDDIPEGLDGKHYINAKNAIDTLNTTGDINTDSDTKTYLQYTAAYDADRFKSMNLSMYRLSLSQKDYDDLRKRQQAIQKGDYFTTINRTEGVDRYIEQVTGIKNKDKELFEQYQNMIRSHEQRTGRAATDIEKEQFLKYLGSDKNNYKRIKEGIKQNAEFHQDLANKINYYRAKHNDDMPPEEMVNKWIKEQTIQYSSKKYNTLKNNAIQNTKKVPNEQITLTNFADNYIPSLGEEIGAKLNVTSRYRPANGKYTSKHSEGRALDIGYITKDGKRLTLNQKIEMIETVLARPDVEAIAISSADREGKIVLDTVMKKYGKKYGSKIQDMNRADANGKTRDQNLGTNHTNHLHITLYKDNTFSNKDIITMKNQYINKLKLAGYTPKQINEFMIAKGLQ